MADRKYQLKGCAAVLKYINGGNMPISTRLVKLPVETTDCVTGIEWEIRINKTAIEWMYRGHTFQELPFANQ